MEVIPAIRITRKEGPLQGHILARSTTAVLFLQKGDPYPYWTAANDVHERVPTLRYVEES